MGQTLTNGVYLPDNGERNCYTGLSQNWQKLDNLIGSHGDSVSFSQTLTEGVEIGKITINGTEISMYHTDYSSKADASNVYTKTEIDTSLSSKADASDLTTHTSNADIHVTSTDKATWNAKQDSLTDTQLSACNSGITSDKVSQYDGYASTKVNKSGDTMTGSLIAPSFVANNIDCSVDSQGDGWIRYSNGLQICWWGDTVKTGNSTKTTNIPAKFINSSYGLSASNNNQVDYFALWDRTSSTVKIYLKTTYTYDVIFYITAIGKWK